METKERIIELADKLIRTKGFNAFSYANIARPLRIKNAAIHYYFPCKTDLGISVIDRDIDKMLASVDEWKDLPEDEQLKKLAAIFRKRSEDGLICLMGALSPDYDTLPNAMQKKVTEMSFTIVHWVANCLGEGRKKKLFRFEGRAYDRALAVVSNLLSSLLLSRVLGKSTFRKMNSLLMEDLG